MQSSKQTTKRSDELSQAARVVRCHECS